MIALEDRVVIGRVVKPHGLSGEVVVEPLSDFPERFREGLRVELASGDGPARDARIASSRPHGGRLLITFEGISDAAAAESLRDAELCVPRRDVAPRPPGYVYHWDIEGAAVVDAAGRALGRVASLVDAGGRPLLVVQTPRGPREVPFAHPIVLSVDVASGRIVLDPPAGLLD
ncbi:MAG: ribosome maturation factor RimM [Thermoanaerobaculia bacterium]